jgi:hypothetical protein
MSRAWGNLERGGELPEGASGPRARWRTPEGVSGPRARQRVARGGIMPSSETENRARGGVRPSSEAENRPRGRQALERGRVCAVWRPVLGRGGNSSEGYRGWLVGGPLWLLWTVGLSTLGCDHSERVFGVRGVFVLCFIIFRRGGFSR